MTDTCRSRHLAPLLLLLAAASANAQLAEPSAETASVPVYDIEVIIFEYREGVRGQREDWRYIDTGREAARLAREAALAAAADTPLSADGPAMASAGDDAVAVSATGPAADAGSGQPATGELPLPLEYRPLARENFRLGEQYERLQRSRDLQPLMHVAWRQPVYDADNETTLALDRLAALPPTLAGSASIYVNRFLHLTLELALAEQRPRVDADDGLQATVYRLSERRKMRSAELHFYDHPRFGALALISRTEETRPLPLPAD